MSGRPPQVGMVDAVWLAGHDGRWHKAEDLAEQVRFEAEEVDAVLRFLVNYGFAESRVTGEREFRMIADSPPPIEAANLLLLLARELAPLS